MTKDEAIKEINDTQDFYVDELIKIIKHINKDFDELKEVDFTSPTGTGKTVMMSKLINKMPDYFFVITTLSRGQLRIQIEDGIRKRINNQDQVLVFGLNEFTKNTKLQLQDFETMLLGKENIVWIRDEGHIATNRWQEVLRNRAISIINFSATNKSNNGIQCNFTHTMMLRTVSQQIGTINDAIERLIIVKNSHKDVPNYNPCALFRILNDDLANKVCDLCKIYNLKVINITEEDFDMSSLCEDGNEYDVIINKFKITEGIDLKRCHVIYMDNKPGNESTVVQVIGRARRNALLWRDDINILSQNNKKLLEDTRQSYIYYNIEETKVDQSDNGELLLTLCDSVSIENLKCDIDITVDNGRLSNGLKILELENQTGRFHISKDPDLGFNVVDSLQFYENIDIQSEANVINLESYNYNIKKIYFIPEIINYIDTFESKYRPRFDKAKYNYQIYEAYCLATGTQIDFDYWRKKLNIDDEYKKAKDEDYREFLTYIKELAPIDDVRFFFYSLYREQRFRIKQNSYVKHAQIPDRVSILTAPPYCTSRLKEDIIKYIDYIEVIDFRVQEKIESILRINNVLETDVNKFAISNHPFCHNFIEDYGIDNLEELKTKVEKTKANSLFKCSTAYLRKMVASISSFEEIDSFEVEYFDLKSLMKRLNHRLTKSEIDSFLTGVYPTKSIKLHPYETFYLYRFDKKTKRYVDLMGQNLFIYKSDFDNKFVPYTKRINDREIAIVGTDTMRYQNHEYVEDRNVTSKITKYCKFNSFIEKKYDAKIKSVEHLLYKKENNLGFDKKCNSCLGFCVEFYAKMKYYGTEQYKRYIDLALKESRQNEVNDVVMVRACMIAYRDTMAKCFGNYMNVLVPTISIEQLIQEKYINFVDAVVFYGQRTCEFLTSKIGAPNTNEFYDPDLSVCHISALSDFITNDTIIDLKCTNAISRNHIKQVLAYHYLSTKRSDLNINRVIVYDAVSDSFIDLSL